MNDRIELVEEITVYSEPDNPWVKLFFDRVRFSNGRLGRYNRVVESGGKTGVAILPIMGSSVGLVRQYRYPIGDDVWEIPRGFATGNEPRIEAAKEMVEETGYEIAPEDMIELGPINPNSGLLSSTVLLYAANCAGKIKKDSTDEEEVSMFMWFGHDKVKEMIRKFEIRDAFTISALFRASLLELPFM